MLQEAGYQDQLRIRRAPDSRAVIPKGKGGFGAEFREEQTVAGRKPESGAASADTNAVFLGKCFRCGKPGHRAASCTDPAARAAPDPKQQHVERKQQTAFQKKKPASGTSRRAAGSRTAVIGNGYQIDFALDSGADASSIGDQVYEELKLKGGVKEEIAYNPAKTVRLANGSSITVLKKIRVPIRLETRAGVANLHSAWVDVLPGISRELLIGLPEWDTLGIPRPDSFLASNAEDRTDGNGSSQRCARIATDGGDRTG